MRIRSRQCSVAVAFFSSRKLICLSMTVSMPSTMAVTMFMEKEKPQDVGEKAKATYYQDQTWV